MELSEKSDKECWDKAKELAKDKFSPSKDGDRYWKYVMGIFKRMTGRESLEDNAGLLIELVKHGIPVNEVMASQ